MFLLTASGAWNEGNPELPRVSDPTVIRIWNAMTGKLVRVLGCSEHGFLNGEPWCSVHLFGEGDAGPSGILDRTIWREAHRLCCLEDGDAPVLLL